MPPGATPASKSRFEMLLSVKEHEMHHRGQLMVAQRVLFEPGGIELRFDLAPERHSSRPLAIVVVQARPARFKVSRSCSRGLHDHRLGQTQLGARRLTLWSEQVARAVDGNWDRQELPHVDDHVYARALGRVLAHELGHLLLRVFAVVQPVSDPPLDAVLKFS